MSSTAPALQAPEPGPLLSWFAGLSPKWLVTMLITTIVVIGTLRFEILQSMWILPIAIGTSIGTELLLSRFARGTFSPIQSAYISGTSMSILTQTQQGVLWPFALGAAISITSKYALTYRGRHLWNPTNFGISILVLLAPGSVSVLSQQWGNAVPTLAVIWVVGLLVATRARILHVSLAYVAAFFAFAALRAALAGESYLLEMAPITGPMYQLFVFFMITDPATTVRSKRGRILVAVLIAAVECAIRMPEVFSWIPLGEHLLKAPPIFALAIVGPIAKLIDLRRG